MIKRGKKKVTKKDQRQIRVGDQRKLCGFTLIEMLIAVTVFALIIGSTIGLFVSAIRSQAKALVSQKLLDETSYVMEYMSRDLRMAKKELNCPGVDCCLIDNENGYNYENQFGLDWLISFIDYHDECRLFAEVGGYIEESPTGDYLTSNDFEVTSLEFNLSGEGQDDIFQPRVTISMTIRKAGATKPEIKIQTTISQRNLDIQQ